MNPSHQAYLLLPVLLLAITGTAISSSCNQTCQEDMEKYYLQGLQAKLLHSLHLRGPLHNVTVPKLTSDQLNDLLLDEERGDKAGSQKKVLVFSTPCSNGVSDCVSFNVSHSTLSTAASAKLRFFIDLSAAVENDAEITNLVPVAIKVFRVFENGEVDIQPLVQEYIELDSSQRWEIPLNVSEVSSWRNREVAGLIISAEYDGTDYSIDGAVKPRVFAGVSSATNPTLILESEQSRKRDRRHGENYCPPESTEAGCCLRDLSIDFSKLGWNFIMAPKKYNAFMCRGDCGVGQNHVVRFGHSKIMKDAKMEFAQHCCHPSEYESLKIIYTRADNEIIITRVPGMIARRCACT